MGVPALEGACPRGVPAPVGGVSAPGVLLQGAHTLGGFLLWGMPALRGVVWRPPMTAPAAGGMHPNGIYSHIK